MKKAHQLERLSPNCGAVIEKIIEDLLGDFQRR
jgi:hypothetical protein